MRIETLFNLRCSVNWLKSIASNPNVQKAFWALVFAILSAVGASIGTNLFQPAPVVITPPSIDNFILMPSPDPDIVEAKAAVGDRGHRPFLMELAKIKAGRRYAAEHPGMSDRAGIALMRAIPQGDVDAAIAKADFKFEVAPVGGPLTNLLDWLAAHPEFLESLVKIFLLLAPLFA